MTLINQQRSLNDYTRLYKFPVKHNFFTIRLLHENQISAIPSGTFKGLTSLKDM